MKKMIFSDHSSVEFGEHNEETQNNGVSND